MLGFPFIFRGALDVRATEINEAMKVAAVHALAELAREDVPDAVIRAYGGKPIRFGPEYIIPKPLDTRVLLKVVPAVAEAAVQSGVARTPLPERARLSSAPGGQPGAGAGNHAQNHLSGPTGPHSASCCPKATTP